MASKTVPLMLKLVLKKNKQQKQTCSPQLCSLALISDSLAEVQCSMIDGLVAISLGKERRSR